MMNKFTLSICAVMLLFSSCSRVHTEDEYGEDDIPTTKNIETRIRSNEQGSYEFYENGHKYKAFLFTDNYRGFFGVVHDPDCEIRDLIDAGIAVNGANKQ